MEENLEKRIQVLEKKCRTLTHSGFILLFFVAYAVFSGSLTVYREAKAQLDGARPVRQRARRARNRAELPPRPGEVATGRMSGSAANKETRIVEAELFILKDTQGNIRGIWSADDETTSFAMTYKENHPIIGMAVDQSNSTISMTDSRQGKIALSLADSIRSISISDETEKNNIYMGLTGSGDASFDMVSTKSSSVVVDGSVSRIDLTGDKAILALAETVGSTVALQAAPSTMGLTFVDFNNMPTARMSTIDGSSEIELRSPTKNEALTISTTPPPKEEPAPKIKDKSASQKNKTDAVKKTENASATPAATTPATPAPAPTETVTK